MRILHVLLIAIVIASSLASGQSWQDCKPEGSWSFSELKESVRRVATTGGSSGWDDKAFNRSGDLASIALLQALSDAEITSPRNIDSVLLVIHEAFACPDRCVSATSDRKPRVTLLLLDYLRRNTDGKWHTKINDAKNFVVQQARVGE
jgi:hypothetical protein